MRSINIKATLARLGYSSGGQNENSGLLKQRRHCSARSVRAKVMIRIAFCFYSGSRSKSPQLLVAAIYIGNRVASMMNEIQQYGYEVPGTNTKHTIGNSKNITKREQHLLLIHSQQVAPSRLHGRRSAPTYQAHEVRGWPLGSCLWASSISTYL